MLAASLGYLHKHTSRVIFMQYVSRCSNRPTFLLSLSSSSALHFDVMDSNDRSQLELGASLAASVVSADWKLYSDRGEGKKTFLPHALVHGHRVVMMADYESKQTSSSLKFWHLLKIKAAAWYKREENGDFWLFRSVLEWAWKVLHWKTTFIYIYLIYLIKLLNHM